jgi:prophage regulatory protein
MTFTLNDAHLRERALTPALMIGQLERYRIIDKKELRRYVPYSSHHVARREAAGTFPIRLQLGENRVGWLLGEILDWIEARKAARAGQNLPSPRLKSFPITETELNRIFDKKDVRRFVPYTSQHVARLEKQGLFPIRIPVGGNRVGWVVGEVLDWIAERVRERDERLLASIEVAAEDWHV